MSDIKPINAYIHAQAPNPIKILIVLEALHIPYKGITINPMAPKEDWLLKLSPNGRIPIIEDPNTGIVIWESGAIIEYLVDTYDKEGKLTVTETKDKWLLKQYLHYQMSGQGPYYGQAMWYHRMQPEVATARERYVAQIVRVMEVLNNILEGKTYLVADKLTYVDYAFVPWNEIALKSPFLKGPVAEDNEIEKKFPHFWAWHERLMEDEFVKKAYATLSE